MQRREEIRTLVRTRNEKTARNRGRLLRLKEKRLRRIEKEKEREAKKGEVEQECKSAEDKEEDSKEVKRQPLRKSVVRENKRREQRKEKRVRKILMAAPYNTVKKSMKEKKSTSMRGRNSLKLQKRVLC